MVAHLRRFTLAALSAVPEGVVSPPARGFARLATVTTVATLVLVAVGGAVRATDSGLACPTWPGCFAAGDFVPALQLNVWLEHSHRLLAGVVGLLIAAQLVWALARFRSRPAIVWPAVAAAVAVNVQAALGALVVLQLLRAELVTAHLGMAMAVVACQLWIAVQAHGVPGAAPAPTVGRSAVLVAGLAYVEILLGGHVSGIAAGLAYRDFPLLGVATFAPVPDVPAAFNVAHRALAVVLVVGVVVLARQVRAAAATGWLARLPWIVAGLLALQIALGVANIWSGLSFLTVIPHLAVASWIWAGLVLTAILARRVAPAPAPAPEPAVAQVAA
jgi:cytochrome c oxidase assembly protein subunit 15